jgi:hypothetical protein
MKSKFSKSQKSLITRQAVLRAELASIEGKLARKPKEKTRTCR